MKLLSQEQKTVLAVKVAELDMGMVPDGQIATQLGISVSTVKRLRKIEDYKYTMDQLKEHSRNRAKSYIMKHGTEVVQKAMSALIGLLDEGKNIEAVKTAFKLYGVIEDKPENKEQDSSVHLHFPSGILPPKEVKNEQD